VAVVAPLIALIVILGVYPKPVLDRITPSVTRLVQHVETSTGTHQPGVATGGPVRVGGTAGSASSGRVP
jgi:NADH-quinone oxidoreductase subunit M